MPSHSRLSVTIGRQIWFSELFQASKIPRVVNVLRQAHPFGFGSHQTDNDSHITEKEKEKSLKGTDLLNFKYMRIMLELK
jgi:hypothetical protein